MFKDRKEAGKLLAERLLKYKGKNTIVLAIPRGGVVVAEEIAKSLGAKLDLIIPRKIGAPGDPEFAIGAVSPDRSFELNEEVVRQLNVDKDYIEKVVRAESIEITRRMLKYRGSSEFPDVKGKTVIIVDDGIATGFTMKVSAKFLRKLNPKKIIIAIPVAPPEAIEKFENEADEVVCLETPWEFYAIGAFYESFPQVSDEEVIKIMKRFARG